MNSSEMNDGWIKALQDDVPMIDDDMMESMMERLKKIALDTYMAPSVPQCPPRKTDAQLRKECPAVQDAYDQYKMMLKLARTATDADDSTQLCHRTTKQ